MVAQGSGSIVNISSIAGLRGSALVDRLLHEQVGGAGHDQVRGAGAGGGGVRVNSVHPGHHRHRRWPTSSTRVGIRAAIDARIPIGREARPDEVTPTVLFLASDESAYCTGGEYVVDGAMSV